MGTHEPDGCAEIRSGVIGIPQEPDGARPSKGFYGRRHGRRLRTGRQALLDEMMPRLGVTVSPGVPIDPAALFPALAAPDQPPIWLEIGFGAGEHLAEQAQSHPQVGILGCEMFVNGITSLLRHVRDRNLANVRIADADAKGLIAEMPDASIDRLFLLFPDPWPKTRHHKRRFVNRETLDQIARILVDGAQVRFASDHPGYTAWTLGWFLGHPSFTWLAEHPSDWRHRPQDWPPTRYEAAALAHGQGSTYLTFQRSPRG